MKKFCLILLLLVAILGGFKLLLSLCDISEELERIFDPIIALLYDFTPLIAVLVATGGGFKVLIAKYNLSLRRANPRMTFAYIILTLILLPLLSFSLVFLLGNLLNFTDARLTSFTTHMVMFQLPYYMLWWLYFAIMAIGGEFAWRGFLEETIKCDTTIKYIFIGSIWWLFTMIRSIIFRENIIWIDFIWEQSVVLILYVVMSFYLADAARSSKTIWTSSAIIGLWTYSSMFYHFDGDVNWQIVGNRSIVTIIVFIILIFVLRYVNKIFNKQKNNLLPRQTGHSR